MGEFVALMRGFFPDIVIGDTEPTPLPTTTGTYTSWLETFREVNGYDLGFLHLDIDWSRDDWPETAWETVEFGEGFGVPVGIIYSGNHAGPSDDRWLAIAGKRVSEYEGVAGGPPAHVLFQSWMDHPDRALPETEPWTLTNLLLTYVTDRTALGFTPGQLVGNIALGRPITVAASEPGAGPERVVDGDAGIHWSAGGGPTQWVEITLDGPSTIYSINLTPAQFPAGETAHRIEGWVGGSWAQLDQFNESTRDGVPIERTPATPWENIERLRVETIASPSWVAWCEIEVISGPRPRCGSASRSHPSDGRRAPLWGEWRKSRTLGGPSHHANEEPETSGDRAGPGKEHAGGHHRAPAASGELIEMDGDESQGNQGQASRQELVSHPSQMNRPGHRGRLCRQEGPF